MGGAIGGADETVVAIGCGGMFRLDRGPMEGLDVALGLRIVGLIDERVPIGMLDVFGLRIVLLAGVAAGGEACVAPGRLKGTLREGGGGAAVDLCGAEGAAGEEEDPIIPPMKLFFMWQRIIEPNSKNPSSRIGETLPFLMYLVYSFVSDLS